MKRILISSLSILMISACGGGSGNGEGNTTLTGQVSNISGLAFVITNTDNIETRSGVINQNNEFEYEDGETITLYLGGAELASATASTNMNLFDFFPNLPQDAASIRQALRLPEYSKESLQAAVSGQHDTRTSSELYTASNIMRVLIALDDDDDTSNGLDLLSGNWNSKLADETADSLGFASNMFDFAKSYPMVNFQEQYAVSINMDVSEPLATLYDMAQVTIQANRIVGHSTPNLSISYNGTYEYDNKQRLNKLTIVSSSTPSSKTTETYEYDEKGNLLKESSAYDTNGDGTANRLNQTTSTYNEFGKRLTLIRDYNQNTGNADFRRTIYNSTFENDRVLLTSTHEKVDYTGDGIFDAYDKYTNRYNTDNLKTINQSETVDENGNRINISSRRVYTYNDQKQVTQEDYEKSFSGDTAQSIDRSEFTRDGNTTTKTVNYISMGSTIAKEVLVETFNAAGNITKKTEAEYANDVLNAYAEVNYSYDNQGRITQCHYNYDTSGDEQFNYATKNLRGFDANGITSLAYKTDRENDGVFTEDGMYEARYGDNAELLTESNENRAFTYSDSTTNDGVRYLIREYLDITREIFQQNFSICFLDAHGNR